MQLVADVAYLIKKPGLFRDDMVRVLGRFSSERRLLVLSASISVSCFFIQDVEELVEKFYLFVRLVSSANLLPRVLNAV